MSSFRAYRVIVWYKVILTRNKNFSSGFYHLLTLAHILAVHHFSSCTSALRNAIIGIHFDEPSVITAGSMKKSLPLCHFCDIYFSCGVQWKKRRKEIASSKSCLALNDICLIFRHHFLFAANKTGVTDGYFEIWSNFFLSHCNIFFLQCVKIEDFLEF